MRLTPAQGQEDVEERDRAAGHGNRHAEVEPVGVTGYLVGGHRDPQRISGLPVVGGLAADLDRQARLISQQGQQFGAEPHRVDTGQAGAREQGGRRPAGRAAGPPGQPVTVQGQQPQAGQQYPLGGQIPVPVAGPGGIERHALRRLPHLVGPFPAHVEFVTSAVTGAEHQIRAGDRGRRERSVGGDQIRGLPQPRIVLLSEPGLLRRGHLQPLAAQGHPLQGRRHRPAEPGQPEPPAPGVAVGGRLGVVDIYRSVSLGPDERDRHDRFPAIAPDHRDDLQAAGLATRDVQAEPGLPVAVQNAALARVYQLQASCPGLVQQRPELARPDRRELDRLLVAVAVAVVSVVAGGSLVERVKFPQQPHLLRAVITGIAQRVQPAPAQVAGDPAAVLARAHQPGGQPQRCRPGPGRLAQAGRQRELDGHRGCAGALRYGRG